MKRLITLLLFIFVATTPIFAQKSFDMRYNEAVEYYTGKQYDLAIKTLDAAKKAPGVTADQKAKADRLIRQCRSELTKLGDLNLSKDAMLVPDTGARDSIYVTAGKKWEVSAVPDWCSTTVDEDVIFITVKPNEDEASRKGVIEVSMGKERTAYVMVTQEGRRDASYTVSIQTIPERAIIYVDQNTGMLADQFQMKEGKHYIRIEKNGFERLDTTIFIPRNPRDADLFHRIALKPTFALLSVDISPEDGMIFDGDARLDISGRQIEMRPNSLKSFNVDQEISYYSLYEGNLIPLHPGQYVIRAESDGFKFAVKNIKIEKGETVHLDFTLSAINGTVSVQDAENAAGAKIFIDEKEVGEVPFSGKLQTGHHKLRVEKPGYQPEHPVYEFDIEEGKEQLVNLSMKRYTTYHFTSDPAYCMVYIDGNLAGTTPLSAPLTEGLHQFRYEKQGFQPMTEEFMPDLTTDSKDYLIQMNKTFPLTITSDEDSLKITITKGRGNNKMIYVDNVKTPATVELPVSKSMYHVRLSRGNLATAYDGYFWFRGGKRDHINLLSYSKENFRMFGINYNLLKPQPALGGDFNKSFQRMGDVTLAELMLFKGMTTSAVKGVFFLNMQDRITYPERGSNPELKPGDELYKDITFLPALSVLFINEEFRIGGALHNNVDFDVLATYTWYPSLVKLVPFNHISGHDIFLGGEFSSRIPIFNVYVRAGLQAFYGQANIVRPDKKSTSSVVDRYVVEPYKIPFNEAQFVVSVGIKLGTKDSKGLNILRVF